MLDVKDIPNDLMRELRGNFDSDPKIVQLRIHQNDLMRRGMMERALDVGKTIEGLFTKVVLEYLKEAEREVEQVGIDNLAMPDEDKEKIMNYAIVMFMACDMIDFAIADINDVLHKHDKDLSFEMFSDIKRIKDLAQAKLKYLQENSGYMEDIVWCDRCDNIYDMAKSKAKSIIRKRKEGRFWGKVK